MNTEPGHWDHLRTEFLSLPSRFRSEADKLQKFNTTLPGGLVRRKSSMRPEEEAPGVASLAMAMMGYAIAAREIGLAKEADAARYGAFKTFQELDSPAWKQTVDSVFGSGDELVPPPSDFFEHHVCSLLAQACIVPALARRSPFSFRTFLGSEQEPLISFLSADTPDLLAHYLRGPAAGTENAYVRFNAVVIALCGPWEHRMRIAEQLSGLPAASPCPGIIDDEIRYATRQLIHGANRTLASGLLDLARGDNISRRRILPLRVALLLAVRVGPATHARVVSDAVGMLAREDWSPGSTLRLFRWWYVAVCDAIVASFLFRFRLENP